MDGQTELLVSVYDDYEASVIESLLRAFEIPSMRVYKTSAGLMKIYMGVSNSGVDIHVPKDLIDKAREVLNSENLEENLEENSDWLSAIFGV